MKADKKDIRVVFRLLKKEDTQQRLDEAFDLLFAEAIKQANNREIFT